jgi:hypothetical protein
VVLLSFLFKILTPVVVAYKLRGGSPFSLRGIASYCFAIAGVLALYAGFDLAVHEEWRMNNGHVSPGVIVEKLSSTSAEGTRPIGTSGGRNQVVTRPVVTIKGFRLYDRLARVIVTGSQDAWVIEYRFNCGAPHPCVGRDFVSEDHWLRLRVGQMVSVRQGEGETQTSRLDDNPQWPFAAADLGIAAFLLLCALALTPAASRRPGVVTLRRPTVSL